MKTFVIGDVQGCYQSLMALLEAVHYSDADRLIFLGDLVNRGPGSLEVLRFASQAKNCQAVLGNHDLHLLGRAWGLYAKKSSDTLDAVLVAKDREHLWTWLCQQTFSLNLQDDTLVCVHGGIPPGMPFEVFCQRSQTLTQAFHQAPKTLVAAIEPLRRLGKISAIKNDADLAEVITNIRFCEPDGTVVLNNALGQREAPGQNLLAWYNLLHSSWHDKRVLFGHWAALQGQAKQTNVLALDTGCVWGGVLTAYCVEEDKRYKVKANSQDVFRDLSNV
ncbi:MAG: symmetrical bis(5'-nucleosyl)-tetraphosphatase [Gammaproteobacteria bacterium CG11_big_fil_rev_8_21_14_0_20_46_22]|nr:MAG: symmetrical bis(5'-nucleosyl)-tetraphosphatase [Gammaproteobacteria bacterium CG12_big_fil_rev_8_21_14_0_65_46_12]PIR10950.1 MAG: symmetrical bis(5'-nucleosyl)-tetraphosphatase [Gammaproteobacteria bacterium CG11_big_fil_rev_8_21_14_0_20_46_22]